MLLESYLSAKTWGYDTGVINMTPKDFHNTKKCDKSKVITNAHFSTIRATESKQNGHIGLTGFGHKACADWSNTLVRFVCILLMLTSNTVKVLSSYLQLMNFFASLP